MAAAQPGRARFLFKPNALRKQLERMRKRLEEQLADLTQAVPLQLSGDRRSASKGLPMRGHAALDLLILRPPPAPRSCRPSLSPAREHGGVPAPGSPGIAQ
jgi:hypothetical protein